MNDYTALQFHRMRTQELEREAQIREGLEVYFTDTVDTHAALVRLISLVIRRRKPQTRTTDYPPRTAAVQCAES